MSDLSPGELYEQFRDELEISRASAQGAASNLDATHSFLSQASDNDEALSRQHAEKEEEALEAIEVASDHGIGEVISAMVRVKGRSEEEAETYASHFEKLSEEGQPVVAVIAVAEDATAAKGLTKVVFGRTSGAGTSLDDVDGQAGQREVRLGLNSVIQFAESSFIAGNKRFPRGEVHVSARTDDADETLAINPGHPFEAIHFAPTQEEAEEIVSSLRARFEDSLPTDWRARRTVDVPTMVAYGDEAVKEVSERLSARSELHALIVARCLDGIDVTPLPPVADMQTRHPYGVRKSLRNDFISGLRQYLKGEEDKEEMSAQLAFISPLQGMLEVQPSDVLGTLYDVLVPRFTVVDDESGYPALRTENGYTVQDEVSSVIEDLEAHGVVVSTEDLQVDELIFSLEEKVLSGVIEDTSVFSRRRYRLINQLNSKRRELKAKRQNTDA